jgi:hypothetical protein
MGIYVYSDKKDLTAELVGFAKGCGKEAIVLTFDERAAEDLRNSGSEGTHL